MKHTLGFLAVMILSLFVTNVNGQQEAHFSQNMFNNVYYNPGFTGNVGGICATGLVRQQWVGFQDSDGNNVAPNTYTVSIHSPVNVLHGGVGLNIYNDKLGFSNEIGVKIMYSYRMDLGMGNLGIGLQVDFINQTIDFAKFRDNPSTDLNDPLLYEGEESDMVFDLGFGLHYMVPGKYYIGLSSTRLLESQSDKINFQYKRHYFLSGGYQFTFPNNPAFELDPSLLIKSDGIKTQFDFAALLKYNNKVWGGVSYSTFRVTDPLAAIIGLKIKDIKIGYSYTIPTSNIGSGGSHEVMIGYCFKINMDRGRSSYKNTRFL
jgi:type IX secretion system PorP/SprF family membrane protein